MPKCLKNIRFSKLDQFNNSVFIASDDDVENYDILTDYSAKLKLKYSSFLPIYHNEEHKFATIRFVKNSKFKPEDRCNYDIEYTIKQKNKDDKVFINCHVNKMVFVSRNIIDDGSEIEL